MHKFLKLYRRRPLTTLQGQCVQRLVSYARDLTGLLGWNRSGDAAVYFRVAEASSSVFCFFFCACRFQVCLGRPCRLQHSGKICIECDKFSFSFARCSRVLASQRWTRAFSWHSAGMCTRCCGRSVTRAKGKTKQVCRGMRKGLVICFSASFTLMFCGFNSAVTILPFQWGDLLFFLILYSQWENKVGQDYCKVAILVQCLCMWASYYYSLTFAWSYLCWFRKLLQEASNFLVWNTERLANGCA